MSTLVITTSGFALILALLVYTQHSNLPSPIYKSPAKTLKAFVLGGTGTAGKDIVKSLMTNPNFGKVTLISRRYLDLTNSSKIPGYSKITQELIDFEDPSTYSKVLKGYDVGFCALGTSSIGILEEEYYRITHDYVVNSAKLAKEGGCRHFHFLSVGLASKMSTFSWARVKAEVEDAISEMDFPRLSIYRTHKIIIEKKGLSDLEFLTRQLFHVMDPFRLLSIDSPVLAKVMVNNTFREVHSKVEILENCDIMYLGKLK